MPGVVNSCTPGTCTYIFCEMVTNVVFGNWHQPPKAATSPRPWCWEGMAEACHGSRSANLAKHMLKAMQRCECQGRGLYRWRRTPTCEFRNPDFLSHCRPEIVSMKNDHKPQTLDSEAFAIGSGRETIKSSNSSSMVTSQQAARASINNDMSCSKETKWSKRASEG